jgi:DNA-binding GntR family transcriptional regulator
MPTVITELPKKFNTDRRTAMKAMQRLEREKRVKRIPGLGYYAAKLPEQSS